MVKTTIYLPDELKAALKESAAREQVSEAELIRAALIAELRRRARPAPRIPLGPRLGDPTLAERTDEALADGRGFGRR